MQPEHASRPGLAEVLTVWILFGVVALEVWVTYARLPLDELYNVSGTGVLAGAGRALVFLNYPTALVAIALLAILAERLRGRLALVAAAGAALCAVVVWPGVVEQSDLDAKPVNALPALGVLIGVVLTAVALRRGGIGASRPFGGAWDTARAIAAGVILLASLPWLSGELGFYLDGVPGFGSAFLSGELWPEPGHPNLTAVHLGHHHGMDGALLALSALSLSRVVPQVRTRFLHAAFGLYVALMFAYGLANAVQDFWYEQLVKRGTTSLEIPSLIVPKASWPWAALVAAALLIRLAAGGVGRFGRPPEEGVP
ncbi:MAG TPA: hypothetical protein VD695_05350 [Gaiellaceae bacterium]|nr:hypothetical protein [Gaiellaceae bacterium]